jgi:ethanolamine-phosphate cytidylyltransferase/choline-phosphate cytidylyltransferase
VIRVYVDMVADLFHFGHVAFLEQARAYGEDLVVGVHSDATVESYKRRPVMTMDERVASVRGCRFVDEVVPDAPLVITREWLELHRIDVVVHGDDFDPALADRLYGVPMAMGIFHTVPYTSGISSTEIIRRIQEYGGA